MSYACVRTELWAGIGLQIVRCKSSMLQDIPDRSLGNILPFSIGDYNDTFSGTSLKDSVRSGLPILMPAGSLQRLYQLLR